MILVTGGTGLVGSHLLYDILRQGKHVRVLIRDECSKGKIRKVFKYYTTRADEYMGSINWQLGDITDLVSLEEAFNNIDQVYHCAAAISFNNRHRQLMSEVNIQGTANIVDLCIEKDIKKLIHVSSIAAVSKSNNSDLYTEEAAFPTGKLSAYAYTKTQSELRVWQGIAEGLHAVIVNPSVILGPGNWNSGSGKLFDQVYKGIKFFTRGVTGFVDVRDVSKVMIELMDSNIHSERFVVSAENISYEAVFKMIAAGLKVAPPKYYASSFLTSVAWRIEKIISLVLFKEPMLTKQSAKASHAIQNYSSEKLRKQLGFNYKSIDTTIKATASFLLKERNG